MKFLCLHGSGSSSHIMEMQTAALRHELEDGHTYEFVEGIGETTMGEDIKNTGFDSVLGDKSSYFAFYNPKDLSTLDDALVQLSNFITAEGPFDVLMGFSAGAVLAASYLLRQSAGANDVSGDSFGGGGHGIAAAVFLSSAQCTDEFESLGLKKGEALINIPTTHIWGTADLIAPTGGQDVSAMCNPRGRFSFVHNGGHELPKKEGLTKAVHAIRKTLQVAEGI